MKKNIQNPILKNIIKHISTTTMLFATIVFLSVGYVVCIYKTVTVASNHEKTSAMLAELRSQVGEKEHVYIEKTSNITLEGAIALGYEKTTESVAYITQDKDTALAIR